jgi:hypothetical protein
MSCSIAAGRTGWDGLQRVVKRRVSRQVSVLVLAEHTHEEGIVNVLAEDVDPSRRADDVARRVSVMLLELVDEIIPACTRSDQWGASQPTCASRSFDPLIL